MGHRTCLDVLRKRIILVATVFELRTFQPENRGILEDKTNSNHSSQHET
jgi:hypothetical protein